MAENKNSFIFYTNWEDTFRALPKDKGYDLLIHILDYVNDRNPETDDILINAVFQQFKNTLKRDLKEYEDKKEERSISGRLGNLKRYHSDLYEKVTSDKLTLKAAEKIAVSRKKSLSDKNIAKLAVSDSVNVSDSVSDINSIDDDVENFSPDQFSEEKEKAKQFLKTSKPQMVDRLRMQHKLSVEHYNEKVDEFVDKKFDWGDTGWKNIDDMAKNFEFWLPSNYKRTINPYKTWSENEFREDCAKHIKTFGKEVLNKFYNHFRQQTPTGEMLFQTKKAWNTEVQLKNWYNENLKNNKNHSYTR